MTRCTVLTHVAFEDLDLLAPILSQRGIAIEDVQIPVHGVPADDSDLWIVLGGPVGVYDGGLYPFIAPEIAAIGDRLRRGKPTLGLCLGAQMMAAALGGTVAPNPNGKELGWSPLTLLEPSILRHLDGLPVLHWHGDAITPPPGAVTLASTPKTPCQAFAVGKTALGLQFHAEVSAPGLERWLVGNLCELSASGIDIPALRAANHRNAPALAPAIAALMQEWLDGAGF